MNREIISATDLTRNSDPAQVTAIVSAMKSMRGYAPFATLGTIHDVAVAQYGFHGDIERTLEILALLPGVKVELLTPLDKTQIYSAEWLPR